MATLDLGRVVGADGKSATLEITGVQNLPYGSDPVITEEVDSTPLVRKYRLGIPAGKPGTNAGGGGAGIDDGSVATDTTYSSVKIEAIANRLSQQIENLDAGGLKSDPQEGESTEAPEMGSVPINADQLGGMTYQMIVDLIYPIGRTITTLDDSDNPNTLYPWQTWERTAKGRFIIGTGQVEDNEDKTSPGDYNLPLNTTGGEEKNKLTVNEMPRHRHEGIVITGIGTVWEGVFAEGNDKYGVNTGESGLPGDFSTIFEGGDQPHNNMPPYQAANIWKRVS